jgi:hypothetical protein
MNCRVCTKPLFPQRAVFLCSCGAYTHGYCWEKHVVDSHRPSFTVGTITVNDQFVPKKLGAKESPRRVNDPVVAPVGKEVEYRVRR